MKLFNRPFFRITLLALTLVMMLTSLSKDKEIHTADYYDVTVSRLFKEGNYSGGFKLLEEGLRSYPNATYLNKLMGQYYLQKKDYNSSRYYLYRAIRDDNANVEAKQLLVNVEETTKNYSSAICYINELLEVNPYWKGLWIKKMNIFRIQGNDVEADRILKRLVEIYPDDVSLKNRLAGRREENLANYRRSGNSREAISVLKEMVNSDPTNMENYVVLSNQLLQSGLQDEALAVVSQGLGVLPTHQLLAEKRVGILTDQQRFGEAIDFVRSYQRLGGTGLSSALTYLEEEAARAAVARDPYTLYGRMYDRSKSTEALEYLLNTAVSRGYTTDALFYIAEAKKRNGDDPKLLFKEYEIYKAIGEKRKALGILERLVERQPQNSDFIDELCIYRLNEGVDMMVSLDYVGAIEKLSYVATHAKDEELLKSALNKKYTCLFETKRYTQASELLDTIRTRFPDSSNFTARKTQILTQQKKPLEALQFIEKLLNDSVSSVDRAFYLYDYEEIALPYIKEQIEKGATYDALKTTENLLRLLPSSYYGLNYALTCTSLLNKTEEYDRYASMAVGYYPDDVAFSVKHTEALRRQKQYGQALEQLLPWFEKYPQDSSLIKAFSAHSGSLAQELIKAQQSDSALWVLNRALLYDETNRDLLYAKGQAFEKLRQYDSAYHYLSYYTPSLMEFDTHKLHMDKIQRQRYPNTLSVEYMQSRLGEQDVLTAVTSTSYSLKRDRNTYTATLNYAGRDGASNGKSVDETSETYKSGGFGLQGIGRWDRKLNEKWDGSATFGLATKYFPILIAQVGATKHLRNNWDVEGHLGFRLIESATRTYALDPEQISWIFDGWSVKQKPMITLGATATKTLEQYTLSTKGDIILHNGSICFTAQGRASYFPMETRWLSFWATAGLGNAPESSVLDASLPGAFTKLNTNVGLGTSYLITPRLTVAASGTWNTFLNTVNYKDPNTMPSVEYPNGKDMFSSKYKNLFSINASLLLSF